MTTITNELRPTYPSGINLTSAIADIGHTVSLWYARSRQRHHLVELAEHQIFLQDIGVEGVGV